MKNGVPVAVKCVWVPDLTPPKPDDPPCPVCEGLVLDLGATVLPVDRQILYDGRPKVVRFK